MSQITKFAFLLAASAALSITAAAQQRGAAVTGGAAPVAAPVAAPTARVSHPAPTTGQVSTHPHHAAPLGVHGTGTTHHATGITNTTTETTGAPQNATPNVVVVPADSGITLQDLTNQAPGLGFDYEHLAAISGNLAEKALIDPATMEELALAERFNRGGAGSSAYILGGYGYGGGEVPVDNGGDPQDAPAQDATQPAPQPPPQIIILQQPAPGGQPTSQNYGSGDNRAAQPQAAPVHLPEASDFLLVLKNGAMVSAVAFTRQGDQLIYVTKEGNRRSMAVATIDSDATSKINAARGTPLKLSI